MPVGNIEPPSSHPDDDPKVCIEVNVGWIPYLIGMVWPAKYPEYWAGTLEQNRTARKDVMTLMAIIQSAKECEMASCCVDDKQKTVRVDPATGMLVQSYDGGVTWKPATGGLQSVIVEPVPPVTSGVSATKCDAATNVGGQVDAWINQVTDDFDTATSLLEFGLAVLEAILVAVVTILSAGTLTAVEALVLPTIGAALFAAWAAGKTLFVAYWTTEIKDKILCAAYCNIGEDGSFTDAQFTAFWNKCNSQLPPSPAKMLFMGFMSSVGRQGLNAMAATGLSADSDCSQCCAACETTIWSVVEYESVDVGEITGRGLNWVEVTATSHPSFPYADVVMIQTPADGNCCVMDHIDLISGEFTPISTVVLCPNPRWPASPTGGASFPADVNTIFLHSDIGVSGGFVCKIYFQ